MPTPQKILKIHNSTTWTRQGTDIDAGSGVPGCSVTQIASLQAYLRTWPWQHHNPTNVCRGHLLNGPTCDVTRVHNPHTRTQPSTVLLPPPARPVCVSSRRPETKADCVLAFRRQSSTTCTQPHMHTCNPIHSEALCGVLRAAANTKYSALIRDHKQPGCILAPRCCSHTHCCLTLLYSPTSPGSSAPLCHPSVAAPGNVGWKDL